MKIRGANRLAMIVAWGMLLSSDGRAQMPWPKLVGGPPRPGAFVRRTIPEYAETQVYHGLYLPEAWQPDGPTRYPVLVEYAPNEAQAFGTTGRVDECRMGYYLGRELDCIWLVLPYVNRAEGRNQTTWWGDRQATIEYLHATLPQVCAEFRGDSERVVLLGFSRGAIACGFLGLFDDPTAKLWRGFLAHSHFDGGRFAREGAVERLSRLQGRPVLITYGEQDNGRADSADAAEHLRQAGLADVTEIMISQQGHTDRWVLEQRPERDAAVAWLRRVLAPTAGSGD